MSPAPQRRLAVAMLTANFYPYVGGTEKQALELSRFLPASGVDATVVTRRLAGQAASDEVMGVPVVRLAAFGSGAFNSFSFLVSSFFYLMRNAARFDVFHVHLASSPALAACLAGKITGRPVVVKIGGGRGIGEIAVSKKTFLGRLKLKMLAWFRPKFLTVNRELLDELREGGLGAADVSIFGNGVDTAVYSLGTYNEKLSARAALGIARERVFLFVGRLAPEKRLAELLEVWAEIKKERASFAARLLIVGEGPCRAQLENAVGVLELGASVTLAGGRANLLDFYRAADVFVLPSVSEGMSNAMLEAMACGLAVMATRRGGASDAVADGKSGFLFDPMNPAEIRRCFEKFMDDDRLALAMGEAGRDIAAGRYSISRLAHEMAGLYGELIGRGK